jgi:hypothetical protein
MVLPTTKISSDALEVALLILSDYDPEGFVLADDAIRSLRDKLRTAKRSTAYAPRSRKASRDDLMQNLLMREIGSLSMKWTHEQQVAALARRLRGSSHQVPCDLRTIVNQHIGDPKITWIEVEALVS